MEKFSNMDEVIEERFWRIFRNFQTFTVKEISDMPIEEMKDILDWLDKCYQTDLSNLNISDSRLSEMISEIFDLRPFKIESIFLKT